MDVEVRIGCLSIKCCCFMDVEVRIESLTRPPGCPKSRHFRTQSAFCNTLKGAESAKGQNRLKGAESAEGAESAKGAESAEGVVF